jgi:asparagine synthase (glutamine-hydrolysing)
MVDSSMIPTYLISSLVRAQCTVALGGDGGDELFGGYPHYNRFLWMQQYLGGLPRNMRMLGARMAETWLPVGLRGRNWLQGLDGDLQRGLPFIASLFDRTTRRALMARHDHWTLVAEAIREERIPRAADMLQRATRMDFEHYLPEDILVKVDRASMLSSLEVRAPLLDRHILDFAFGKVPSHLKATPASRKVLLKKLAARLLPPEFDRHRKQGFSIPLGSWLRTGPWHTFFREVLLDSDSSLFDRRVVIHLLDSHGLGRSNSERLFALVLFELWQREYQATMP